MEWQNKTLLFIAAFALVFLVGQVIIGGFIRSNNLFSLNYEEVSTTSGLKIFFVKDGSLPYIQFSAHFPRAGADYDFEGKSGLSSLTALLSDQGAGGLSSSKLQEEINQLGSGFEFQVGRQKASFSLSGLSWHSEALWDLFQKIVSAPHFEAEEMEILKKQALSRRRQQLDRPGFVADFVWREGIFSGSPGKSDDGTLISLSKISLEDIKKFHESHYLGGRPSFVVLGRYNNSLRRKIISFVNGEPFSLYPDQKEEGFSPFEREPQFQLLTNDSLVQAEIRMGYSLGPFPIENPRRFLALQIADFVLGGSGSDRLSLELREKRGLTYSVRSRISFGKFYGFFEVDGSSKTDSVREFLEEALEVLKQFREKGLSLNELKAAKESLSSKYLLRIERPESQMNLWLHYSHYLGLDSHFLENYTRILKDISLDELNSIIREFILSKPLHVVVYGHSSLKTELEGLREDGFPELKVISFEDYFKEELNFKKEN